jgi:hypothetical protein
MNKMICCVALLGMMMTVGCIRQEESQTSETTPESNAETSTVDAKYIMPDEPEGAQDVIAVRESAQDGDEILITGRIGGEMKPFVEGLVAFKIVDHSLKACSDIPGDACETPWDYCCETDKLPGATAFVELHDKDGNLVKGDAKDMLNVNELSTVVVKGKAQRDEEGNLTVVADSVYVK